jgi:ribose 5-phosphate isomerase
LKIKAVKDGMVVGMGSRETAVAEVLHLHLTARNGSSSRQQLITRLETELQELAAHLKLKHQTRQNHPKLSSAKVGRQVFY